LGYDRSVLGFPSFEIPPNKKVNEHTGTPTDLVDKILTVMRIPECALLLWFDAETTGAELMAAVGDSLSMAGGFHPLAGICMSPFPDKVKNRMEQGRFRLLIWIGRNVVEGSRVAFTVVLAHELRHVEQFLHNPQIHYAGRVALGYLRRLSKEERERHNYFDSPVEHDAEARARQVAVAIHGEAAVRGYYEDKGIREFVEPRKVHALAELVEALKSWLRQRWTGIVGTVHSHPEPDEFRELVGSVEWGRMGLPDPRK
jgi:hypothetical protein